jgi:hypothetical protein
MSDEILNLPGKLTGNVSVTRFCGPATLGEDRRCYQVSGGADFVALSKEEAVEVAKAILMDAGYSLAGLFEA